MAANFEFLFVSSIANLTEGHLPTGNRVANANLLIRGSLIIPLLLKIPRLNIFSENCEEKFSKMNNPLLVLCSPAPPEIAE